MTELITPIGENKYKLRLGHNDEEEPLESILSTTLNLEEFDIWFEIESDNDVHRLKKLYKTQGDNVRKLSWSNGSKYKMSTAKIIKMLNYFAKLEVLELSSWCKTFSGEFNGKLHMPNIKCLSVFRCKNFIFDFLTTVLPENSIQDFNINHISDVEDKLCDFINKQTSIKRFSASNVDLKKVEPLNQLKLNHLRCILYRDKRNPEKNRIYLQTLIKSQVNLTSLDLFNEEDYSFSYVNNDLFADICALSRLESLSISIDSLTSDGIKVISKLSSLKYFRVKSVKKESMEILKNFSIIKNSSLINLILDVWYEISGEIYAAIGFNYKNLKSLTIALATRRRISFFAKTFPNLESLSIRFGVSSDPVKFEHVYDMKDDIKLPNLKILKLRFCVDDLINGDSFLKFMSNFTSLDKLHIESKFPFTADFIKKFTEKLHNIKSVKLFFFEVENVETFTTKLIDVLKTLRSKLDSVYLLLMNFQAVNCCEEFCKKENCRDDFTYKLLIDSLRGIYELRETGLQNTCIYNELEMCGGIPDSWYED